MLVLSRKLNERIVIGEKIKVMVVEIRGDTVRLGIAAPTDVPVDREEVRRNKVAEGIRNKRPLREIEEQLDWEDNQSNRNHSGTK